MKRQGTIRILGSGGSMGVPMIGCSCEVCTSTNPNNKRLRSSALLSWEGKQILIDASPDLRQQALTYGLTNLDGVIFTHAHYDHTGGTDDLRAFFVHHRKPIPFLMSETTHEDLQQRFSYIFTRRESKTIVTQFILHHFPARKGSLTFEGLPLHYFTYQQAGTDVNGLRFGDLAYITDIQFYKEDIYHELEGIETLVISALREELSPLHFTVDEAVAFAEKTSAKKVYLVHAAHELEYEKTNKKLPKHIRMASDGLVIPFIL